MDTLTHILARVLSYMFAIGMVGAWVVAVLFGIEMVKTFVSSDSAPAPAGKGGSGPAKAES